MALKHLNLLLTYNCNFNCKHCLFKDRLNTSSINLKLLDKILKQAKKLEYNLIALTGGEPYLHSDFDKIIRTIINNEFYFGISTNGYFWKEYSRLSDKYPENFKYITFSLDSHKEKIHDSIRKKCSFKKTIEGIKHFVKKDINVKVSICLNKENYNNLENYVKFVTNLGVKDIRFLSVIPLSWNKKLVLTDKQRKKVLDLIPELRKKFNIKIITYSSLNLAQEENFCTSLDLTGLTINPLGELIFCCDIPQKGAVLGDLKKQKLKTLINQAEKIADYLKSKRIEYLKSGKKIQGYDTCYFCNQCLKNKFS